MTNQKINISEEAKQAIAQFFIETSVPRILEKEEKESETK